MLDYPERQIQYLTDRARQKMSHHRFCHVLGVTHISVVLASFNAVEPHQAAVAALLHDQSKEIQPERLREELHAWGEAVPEDDFDFPNTWHGMHAACLARRQWGLTDEALLEAVALHTTADADVGPLTRILFVADYCEPLRRRASAGQVYDAARENLDAAFRMALEMKVRHVVDRGIPIHPRARRAVHHYLSREVKADFVSALA